MGKIKTNDVYFYNIATENIPLSASAVQPPRISVCGVSPRLLFFL